MTNWNALVVKLVDTKDLKYLDYIAEKNPLKYNKFTPGT